MKRLKQSFRLFHFIDRYLDKRLYRPNLLTTCLFESRLKSIILAVETFKVYYYKWEENRKVTEKTIHCKDFVYFKINLDIQAGRLTKDRVMDNFIKAVMNNDMHQIKYFSNKQSKRCW